jgi:hypothetical protein
MDATRAPAERHPAYPWLMGASLGLSAVGLYYLAGYFYGWPWGIEPAVALWLSVFGGVPALGGLFEWLALVSGSFMRGWLAADDDQAEDLADAPEPVAVSPLVGGYELDETERYHFEGLLRTFQHAAAAGSLKSGALIPAAFDNWGHWGYWTDQAAKSGLCVKANGVPTTLPADRTYAWAVGEIRKGNIIWPAEDAPAPQPLPHPFRAGLAYKLTLEKVSKGAEKVGKDEDD